jgi:hypothetical protein
LGFTGGEGCSRLKSLHKIVPLKDPNGGSFLMAKRRMFNLTIVDDDVFLSMPISAQALYYHLGMRADDDGFVTPLKVMRAVGANADDLRILIAKRYLLAFDSGVVVIKGWHVNNTIRQDRHIKTSYQTELASLTNNEWGAYTEKDKITTKVEELSGVEELSKKNDNQMTTEVKLDKVKLDKVNTIGDKSPDDIISSLYYQAIKSLNLPVKNHNNVRLKIKAMQREEDQSKIIKYLEFMRDKFDLLNIDFKPHINDGIDIYIKRKQIENAIKLSIQKSQENIGVVI